MSVPKSLRGESKLEVFVKVEKLACYTLHICNNENHFPKRYRWCLTSKIIDSVLEIHCLITKANAIYVKDESDYKIRKSYSKMALSETYSLLSMLDIAFNMFKVESNRIEFWTTLVMEVQSLIRRWIESDEKRHWTSNMG